MTDVSPKMQRVAQNVASVVLLDVGGTIFKTSKATLLRVKGSYFHALLGSGQWKPDGPGDTYFLDLDPAIFRHVLQLLRTDVVLAWKGLPKDDRYAFMLMLEYLNLNNVGVQSFRWYSYTEFTQRMTLSNGLRTATAKISPFDVTFARCSGVLVGACRVLVEEFEDNGCPDDFGIGVGAARVPNNAPMTSVMTLGYFYRNSGRVGGSKCCTHDVEGNLPPLGRGDVVTIRRCPSHVAFSWNDGEPVLVDLADTSEELFPVVWMTTPGTKVTLLN